MPTENETNREHKETPSDNTRERHALAVLRRKEEELGKGDPGLTEYLVELAKSYEDSGRQKEAERTYTRILGIWEAVFDPRYGFRHFLADLFGMDSSPARAFEGAAKDDLLALTPEMFLGGGGSRVCYSFPGNPDLCIKVDRPWNEGRNHSRRLRIKKALMPWLHSLYCNKDEVRFYWKKARSIGEDVFLHAPRCFGIVKTNLGPGLVLERIRDRDGSYSERLGDFLLKRPGMRDHLLALVDELVAFFRERDIILFCWNPDNVVVRQDPVIGDRLVAIDWKSEHKPNDDFPFTSLFPSLAREKMERKVRELKRWIMKHGTPAC